MSIIREALNKIRKYETSLDTDGPFRKGQFVINKKRFSCDINPQNKICIEKLPLGMVPCIIAIEDEEPGYFKFIKQHSVRFGKDRQFSKVEQTPLTTKYCENRQEAAKEIIRLESEDIKEDFGQKPFRIASQNSVGQVTGTQGFDTEEQAKQEFNRLMTDGYAEIDKEKEAVITLDKLVDGEYEQVKRYNVYSDELLEDVNWNSDEEVYNKEVAEKLFKEVNANAPIEEYVLHTPEDFYNLFRSGDYIVMTAGTMEDIMEEVIDSLQKTLPAELQTCFDSKRALDVCMTDIHKLSSVYIQVQALDKRFDTEFGMIQKETLLKPEMTHYYIVNITE